MTREPGRTTCRADWRRRLWPWPRLDPYLEPVRITGLVRPDDPVLDTMLNGGYRTREDAAEHRDGPP